jgi:hypothetical protein
MSRWRMTFWLDDQNERDYAVGQAIAALKTERKFVSTVRDGIRLMLDLRAGRTDVLFELFPHLANTLHPPVPLSNTREIEYRLEQLQQAVLNHARPLPAAPAAVKSLAAGSAGLQPLAAFKPLLAPTFDDDDTVVIRRDSSAGSTAAANFLDSVLGLQ